ncbi:MAG: acetoin utilization protein AcuC [Fimbriimonadales bacterium]
MSVPNFFYRDEMTRYNFGPQHPLKPIRLERTVALLQAEEAISSIAPDAATDDDLLLVHSPDYVEAVKLASELPTIRRVGGDLSEEQIGSLYRHGLGTGDNPIFENMHEHSLWYVGGAVACASAVLDGDPLAFNISGGLHHAQRDHASGFCVYNDPAIMVAILQRKFERVAYVDIDLHHGDGVQAIFYDDPSVMSVSIHESGRTLYPGTGFVHEVGTPLPHCVNIPLEAGTTGDVWLDAFRRGAIPRLRQFCPEAIVLQMGCDAHFSDPLGHLMVTVQEWLEAVVEIRDFGVPVAVCGGGGYDLRNVPRMWTAACMTLARHDYRDAIPTSMHHQLGVATYSDSDLPAPRNRGGEYASQQVAELEKFFA